MCLGFCSGSGGGVGSLGRGGNARLDKDVGSVLCWGSGADWLSWGEMLGIAR